MQEVDDMLSGACGLLKRLPEEHAAFAGAYVLHLV